MLGEFEWGFMLGVVMGLGMFVVNRIFAWVNRRARAKAFKQMRRYARDSKRFKDNILASIRGHNDDSTGALGSTRSQSTGKGSGRD